MPNAVIAGYARTPFHFAKKGGLTQVRPDDLAAAAVRGLIERTGVNTQNIEDLILGCSYPRPSRAATWRGWWCFSPACRSRWRAPRSTGFVARR